MALAALDLKLPKHFTDLLVVTSLVITDKRNSRYAVDVAQEWMLEYQLLETVGTMSGAKLFEAISGVVKVFDCYVLVEHSYRRHSFWRFHANKAGGHDGGGH